MEEDETEETSLSRIFS
jgi:hypothetical protein